MTDGLKALADMGYSGRAFILGKTLNGNPFAAYSLTGRSDGSQARLFVSGDKTGVIRTEVTDKKELENPDFNPALLLYPALILADNTIIVGNGIQTELVYSALCSSPQIEEILRSGDPDPAPFLKNAFRKPSFRYDQKNDVWIDITTYEPDDPHYTPRITGLVIGDKAAMYIVRRDSLGNPDVRIHSFDLIPGEGKLITTYSGGNESPLAPFVGNPLDVTISSETAEDIAESVYAAIEGGDEPGKNFRVAAATMLIDRQTDLETRMCMIDRFTRGS